MSEQTPDEQQQENKDPIASLFTQRIIGPAELAAVFGFKPSWVHRQRCSDDPPPKCKVGKLRFDTASPKFRAWMLNRLDHIISPSAVDDSATHA